MDQDTSPVKNSKNKEIFITVAVLLAVVLIAVGVIAFTKNSDNPTESTSQNQTDTTTSSTESQTATEGSASTTPETPAQTYKDGTYTATGTYSTPGGTARIGISITIDDDKVTATTAESMADNPTSAQYQGEFVDGYKSQVVGRDIDEIQLTKVSGSSLTPKGFNNALDQIKAQAKG